MTATAQELLDRFAEIGASVCTDGDKDRLIVRAGAQPVPAALVRQLREAKAQILAALGTAPEPQTGDAGNSDPDLAAAAFHQSHEPLGTERLSEFAPERSAPKRIKSISAVDALRVARIGGNKLMIDGDDLKLEACAPPPPFVLDLVSRHKAEIIRLLLPGRDGWSAQDWQVFFDERVDICKLDGLVPREQAEARAFDWCVAEWLNRNSMRSPAGACFGCSGEEEPLDPLLPFGIAIGDRVWLHSRCQPAWSTGRKAKAISELANMGICSRSKPNGADINAVEVLMIACVAGIKLRTDADDLLLQASASPPVAVLALLSRHNDVLIFTLGLTEAWRSRRDGAVFPVCPGVSGGVFDSGEYEFVNFRTHEIVADLQTFITSLRQVNPAARIIFTVSPVPLVATAESRHVLVSTTYSKSALRAACEEVCRDVPGSYYFPSYEIITGSFNRGQYFASNLREVNEAGVSHVMRVFLHHYTSGVTGSPTPSAAEPLLRPVEHRFEQVVRVICDEEALSR